MPLVLAPLMNLLLALLTPLVLALLISCVFEVLDISSTEFLFSTGSFSGDATKARRLVVSVVPSVAAAPAVRAARLSPLLFLFPPMFRVP